MAFPLQGNRKSARDRVTAWLRSGSSRYGGEHLDRTCHALALRGRDLGKDRQREHLVRSLLRVRKPAALVPQIRVGGQQMHRNRIVNAGLNPLGLERVLPSTAIRAADR